MSGFWELPVRYDVLVAATEECLPGYSPQGWIEFEKVHETPASTTYKLRQGELGDMGEVEVRKLSEEKSEIFFTGPPRPTKDEGLNYAIRSNPEMRNRVAGLSPTPAAISLLSEAIVLKVGNDDNPKEWYIEWPPGLSREEKRKIFAEAAKLNSDWCNTLHNKRKEHLERVKQAYFDRLGRENIWPEETAGKNTVQEKVNDSGHYSYPPQKRKEIVREYRQARNKGEIKNKNSWAQSKHGITGRTLRNYEREFPEES